MPTDPRVPPLFLGSACKHSSYAFVGRFVATESQNEVKPLAVVSDSETVYGSEGNRHERQAWRLDPDCDLDSDWDSVLEEVETEYGRISQEIDLVGVEDTYQLSDVSTAATEWEGYERCILCSGSGLLFAGFLPDLCPLCPDEYEFSDITVESDTSAEVEYQVDNCKAAKAWNWKELTLEDEPHLRPYFTESLVWASSSEVYFTDLVHRSCPASYAIEEGLLLVRRWEDTKNGCGKWLLLPPLFKALPNDFERVAAVMRVALELMPGSCFDVVSEKYLSLIHNHLSDLGLTAQPTDPAEWDYIYSSQELMSLDGSSSLKEKRRRARTFENRYAPKVIPLSPNSWSESLLDRCRTVAESWVMENGVKVGSAEEDSECLRDHRFTLSLLEHFVEHPNMRGTLIEVEGQPVALALVELEHGGRMLLSHVEKSLLKAVPDSAFARGIYPFNIRAYLQQWSVEGFDFVNRESDDGIPGLRESKNLYKPMEWRKKFIISWR